MSSPESLGNLYEVVVLLRVLGQVQGERIPIEAYDTDDVLMYDRVSLRRKILDSLCIVCDSKRGGSTVTAMALEDSPDGPTYWVSSNMDIYSETQIFLRNTLETLGSIKKEDDSSTCSLETQLFKAFTNHGSSRLVSTLKILQKEIVKELKFTNENLQKNSERKGRTSSFTKYQEQVLKIVAYEAWLQTFRVKLKLQSPVRLLNLCKNAYDGRKSKYMKPGYREQMLKISDDEWQVRHLIGRLGSTMRAAKLLAQAASRQQFLFKDFKIRFVEGGIPWRIPSMVEPFSLDYIAKRIASDESIDIDEIKTRLDSLESSLELTDAIKSQYRNRNFRPIVHAELTVLEKVFTEGIKFHDNDKYIACSKPACFCCYHYINSHPGGFVQPACHNKLWPNWRPPSLLVVNQISLRRHQKVLSKMIGSLRDIACERILNPSDMYQWRYDSSTGVTSTISDGSFGGSGITSLG